MVDVRRQERWHPLGGERTAVHRQPFRPGLRAPGHAPAAGGQLIEEKAEQEKSTGRVSRVLFSSTDEFVEFW